MHNCEQLEEWGLNELLMNNICARIDILQRNSCFHRKEILCIEKDGVNWKMGKEVARMK